MNASERQIQFMQQLGLVVPANIQNDEAKRLISEELTRRGQTPKTPYSPPKVSTWKPSSSSISTSDKEVAETKRNKSIVRQSSLNRATELIVAGKLPLDSWKIIAEEFENWVNRE